MVFDPVGGPDAHRWIRAIKPGGLLVPLGAGSDPVVLAAAGDRDVRTATVLVEPDGHALECLAELAATGRLKVHIDGTLPLSDAAKAHEIGERGRTRGKLVRAENPIWPARPAPPHRGARPSCPVVQGLVIQNRSPARTWLIGRGDRVGVSAPGGARLTG